MDIRKLRTQLGLTQSEVANKCGVSLYTYQLWERGNNKPNPENLKKLKKVLKVEV